MNGCCENLRKETRCESIKINGRGDKCWIDIADGGNRAENVEFAVNLIKSRLNDLEYNDERMLDCISFTRNYNWCEHHDCYGHTTEECRALQKIANEITMEVMIP